MIYRIMNQAVILSNPSSHSASKTNYIFKAISMVDNFFPQYKADQQFMTTWNKNHNMKYAAASSDELK